MSVLLETSLGDLVIDLYFEDCPKTCFNFLRLCMLKKLNNRIFSSIQKNYLATVTTDPSYPEDCDRSVFE